MITCVAAVPPPPSAAATAQAPPAESPSSSYSLPVTNPVTDYEKLHRIGEGTYGVVCE